MQLTWHVRALWAGSDKCKYFLELWAPNQILWLDNSGIFLPSFSYSPDPERMNITCVVSIIKYMTNNDKVENSNYVMEIISFLWFHQNIMNILDWNEDLYISNFSRHNLRAHQLVWAVGRQCIEQYNCDWVVRTLRGIPSITTKMWGTLEKIQICFLL